MRACERRPSGMSVLEVAVSVGLFGLVLGVVGQLTVAAYRVHTRSTDRATVFRQASSAVDRMGRELRLCREVYAPAEPAAGWEWGRRFEGDGTCLVFRRGNPAQGEDLVVAYRFEGTRRSLDRLVYAPDFDPRRPETQVVLEERVLASRVDGFAFWPVDPRTRNGAAFVGVEVGLLAEPESAPGRSLAPTAMPGSPLRTEVRVKGL